MRETAPDAQHREPTDERSSSEHAPPEPAHPAHAAPRSAHGGAPRGDERHPRQRLPEARDVFPWRNEDEGIFPWRDVPAIEAAVQNAPPDAEDEGEAPPGPEHPEPPTVSKAARHRASDTTIDDAFRLLLATFPHPDAKPEAGTPSGLRPWRLEELAAASGGRFGLRNLYRLKNGELAKPSLEFLRALADVMGFPPALWLTDPADWEEVLSRDEPQKDRPPVPAGPSPDEAIARAAYRWRLGEALNRLELRDLDAILEVAEALARKAKPGQQTPEPDREKDR